MDSPQTEQADGENGDSVGRDREWDRDRIKAAFSLPGSHSESRDDISEFDAASSLAVNYSERDFSERDPQELDELVDEDEVEIDDEGNDHCPDPAVDNEIFPEGLPYPGIHVKREPDPELPTTCTLLQTPDGGKIYIVGTAHFSESSQEDVAKTIQATQPDFLVLELCSSRRSILYQDEQTLLEEAKNINLGTLRRTINQSGVIQGITHLLLLSMSANLTKELGMAPGGEFRRAYREAQKIPGCEIHLGDRPIQVTLRRLLGSLSWWQKMRLAWHMITSKDTLSKEDVERFKEKDILEEMLKEMAGEFPAFSEVFVRERDLFLTYALRRVSRPIPHPNPAIGSVPAVVVGVVGIGHVQGIKDNWDADVNIKELMFVPPGSYVGTAFKWSMRAAMVGMLSWGCYKAFKITAKLIPRS